MSLALGLLCYKKGGSALCYKKGGSALAYKGEPRPIHVNVHWSPDTFVCETYHARHSIVGGCSWRSTSGTATQTGSHSGTMQLGFSLKVTQAPATIELSLTGTQDGCAANELGNVTFTIRAVQRGVSPMVKTLPAQQCDSTSTATINIDAQRNLSSIT